MKKVIGNIRFESKGLGIYNVYKNDVLVGSYRFHREWFRGYPHTSGHITDNRIGKHVEMNASYAKDARVYVAHYFENN